ncbi:MAG: glycosyltransferase family 4 protein [Proteobacteria bacterium]|jgi:glycosyltransferase involved in cell wall biosynthesis|nr:glycosyltransferase family 4 protein [Pseudomonadota bacterium]
MKTKLFEKAPAIIGMSNESIWGSCKVITPNLVKAYELAYKGRVNSFGYNEDMTRAEVVELARSILKSKPSRLVIVDHMPHPAALFFALDVLHGAEKLPPVDVHLYGDFTLYTPEWIKIEPLLKKMKLRFFCASPRQRNFIFAMTKKFSGVYVCPFPVDPKVYKVDSIQRKEFRREHGLNEEDLLLCYTGRISFQKNNLRLSQEVLRFMKDHPERKVKFILAGTFDNMGAPFFGFRSKPGEYLEKWSKWHSSVASEYRKRIIYLGQVGPDKLSRIYNGSDVFVSLSTHHDEDYGMSPVEALFCGCPSVLSSWGGYEGFTLKEDGCVTVPLKLKSGTYQFSSEILQSKLRSIVDQRLSTRKTRAQFYKNRFSIEAAAKIIGSPQNLKSHIFSGWSSGMREHAQRLPRLFAGERVFEPRPNEKSFYYRIYKWYSKG